jgi:hypothetical protein
MTARSELLAYTPATPCGGKKGGEIMGHAIGAIVLAFAASVQPTMFLRSIAFIDAPVLRARTAAWQFALGQASMLLGIGLIAAVGIRIIIRGSTVPTTVVDTTDVVLGGLAVLGVAVGAVLWVSRRRGGSDGLPSMPAPSAASSPFQPFVWGARSMATNITTLALYIAAVGEAVSIAGRVGIASALLIGVTIVVLSPSLTAPTLEVVAPEVAERFLPRIHHWMLTRGLGTEALVSLLAGGALLARGILD